MEHLKARMSSEIKKKKMNTYVEKIIKEVNRKIDTTENWISEI